MIIIGYQGIGKSTCSKYSNCIDLESGCFWHDGKRPDDWYIYYCQIAENLSRQGNLVFVSSHEPVREFLRKSKEHVICVHPSPALRDEWVDKLYLRWKQSKLEKDYKAFANAADRYIENIGEIMQSGIPCYSIDSMEYNLFDIIQQAEMRGRE